MKTVKNNILFKFLDEVSGNQFKNKTAWGFVINDRKEDVKWPRWGKVISTGADVKQVKIDDYILIEPLMWSLGVEHEENRFWSTSEEKVICVSKEEPQLGI